METTKLTPLSHYAHDKQYQTRDGRAVVLSPVEKEGDCPLFGTLPDGSTGEWTAYGNAPVGLTTASDLFEVVNP